MEIINQGVGRGKFFIKSKNIKDFIILFYKSIQLE